MTMIDLGRQIERRRKELDLRQHDLAEMSGVTTRTIHDMETGKGNPAFDTINNVLDVLGLAMSVDIKILN